MVFSSCVFLFAFLPAVYLLHLAVPKIWAKNAILIIFSLLFYSFGEPVYVFLMLGSVFVNYLFSLLLMDRFQKNKAITAVAVVFNIGLLVVFKYAGFLVSSFNFVTGLALPVPDIRLPIGISFFTFQALSYVIDVYRDPSSGEKNFANILLYISLFPQLIAGPIIIWSDIRAQIKDRTVTLDKTVVGIRRFICGLSKKLIIANAMGEIADTIFALNSDGSTMFTAWGAWFGAIAYCLHIYFDFSGYSDMAVGIGSMFGFDFAENFRHPYTAVSIQDFWHKWHITLSTWFRSYLYFPLGGSRVSKKRAALNRMIVFICTGLWHGASVNFLLWGIWHGLFLLLEGYDVIPIKKIREGGLIARISTRVYTLLVVLFGFVLFRADTFSDALSYFAGMFTPGSLASLTYYLDPYRIFMFVLAIVFSLPILEKFRGKAIHEKLSYVLSPVLLTLCIMSLASSAYNPFIYFRF